MQCGTSSFISYQGPDLVVSRFRCKNWNCSYCGPKRHKRLAKEAYLGNPNKFLTLTCRIRDDITPDEGAAQLVDSWKRMREEIQRSMGIGPIPFIAVFEKTENGWPHLHILFRGPYISQRWISMYMKRRMDSPIVDIQAIKSRKKSASYVAKYFSKTPHQFKNRKRYWRNTAYIPPLEKKKPSPHEWWLVRTSLETYAFMYDITDQIETQIDLDRINIPLPDL